MRVSERSLKALGGFRPATLGYGAHNLILAPL